MGGLIFFSILFLVVLSYHLIVKSIKDAEPVADLLKDELAKLDFSIVEERPLSLWEDYQYHEPGNGPIYFSRVSPNRLNYKSIKLRHLVVKNQKSHYFELYIRIFKTWENTVSCEIVRKIRMTNQMMQAMKKD